MVPDVWIEQTTYRLQGGCSTTELIRRFQKPLTGDLTVDAVVRFDDRACSKTAQLSQAGQCNRL